VVRALDGLLNGLAAVVLVLLVTGGVVYRDPHVTIDAAKPAGWVAGFLALWAARRLLTRGQAVGEVACLGHLRRAGERLARAPAAVYAIIAAWATLLAAVAIRRHATFGTGFDLGIFDQALWNTARGRILFSSIKGETTLLADHLDPLLLLLVPFYWVSPSPVVPLVAQSAALALGAVPLYWLARLRFPGSVLAPLFPLLYLGYLPLRNMNRFDFHPTAFAPALLLAALYFMERARWAPMVSGLVLAGLTKENMPAAGVGVGLYQALVARRWWLGGALVALFGLWLVAGVLWIIPAFNPGGYPYFGRYGAGADAIGFASELRLAYIWDVFAPLAFVPVLAPTRLLPGLPFFAQNLLSTAEAQVSIAYHYTAEVIPFVFYAAVAGAATLLARWPSRDEPMRRHRQVAGVLLAASLLLHDRPEAFHLLRYRTTPHLETLAATLRTIPADAAVSAQNRIVPHLAHRPFVYVFPDMGPAGTIRARYVVVDRTMEPWPLDAAGFAAGLAALPARGFAPIAEQDGIVVFRREAP
jgi:uncharacterized membrane protein